MTTTTDADAGSTAETWNPTRGEHAAKESRMIPIETDRPECNRLVRFRYLNQRSEGVFSEGMAKLGPGWAKWFEKQNGDCVLLSNVTHWKYIDEQPK